MCSYCYSEVFVETPYISERQAVVRVFAYADIMMNVPKSIVKLRYFTRDNIFNSSYRQLYTTVFVNSRMITIRYVVVH